MHLCRLGRRKVHETFPPNDRDGRGKDVDDRASGKAKAERHNVLDSADGVAEGGGNTVDDDERDCESDSDDVFHGVSPLFLFWFKSN